MGVGAEGRTDGTPPPVRPERPDPLAPVALVGVAEEGDGLRRRGRELHVVQRDPPVGEQPIAVPDEGQADVPDAPGVRGDGWRNGSVRGASVASVAIDPPASVIPPALRPAVRDRVPDVLLVAQAVQAAEEAAPHLVEGAEERAGDIGHDGSPPAAGPLGSTPPAVVAELPDGRATSPPAADHISLRRSSAGEALEDVGELVRAL